LPASRNVVTFYAQDDRTVLSHGRLTLTDTGSTTPMIYL